MCRTNQRRLPPEIAAGRCDIRIELKNTAGLSDFEYACHRLACAGDAHPAAALLNATAAVDQHPQSGAVDVVQLGQIDHHPRIRRGVLQL